MTTRADAEFKKMRAQAKVVYKKIMQEFRRIKRNGFTMADCKNLYSEIYGSKNIMHYEHPEQPVTYMYLAFRQARDNGILAKLRDRMVELASQDFVLK